MERAFFASAQGRQNPLHAIRELTCGISDANREDPLNSLSRGYFSLVFRQSIAAQQLCVRSNNNLFTQ